MRFERRAAYIIISAGGDIMLLQKDTKSFRQSLSETEENIHPLEAGYRCCTESGKSSTAAAATAAALTTRFETANGHKRVTPLLICSVIALSGTCCS